MKSFINLIEDYVYENEQIDEISRELKDRYLDKSAKSIRTLDKKSSALEKKRMADKHKDDLAVGKRSYAKDLSFSALGKDEVKKSIAAHQAAERAAKTAKNKSYTADDEKAHADVDRKIYNRTRGQDRASPYRD